MFKKIGNALIIMVSIFLYLSITITDKTEAHLLGKIYLIISLVIPYYRLLVLISPMIFCKLVE